MNRTDNRSNGRVILVVLAGVAAWGCGASANDAPGSAAAASSETPAAMQATVVAAASGAAGKSTTTKTVSPTTAANGPAGNAVNSGSALAVAGAPAAGSG